MPQALTDLGVGTDASPFTVATGDVTVMTATNPTATNNITITAHDYITGDKITYDSEGGAAITGLTDGEEYYAIRVDANTIRIAETFAEANNEIPVVLGGTGNSAQTFTKKRIYISN